LPTKIEWATETWNPVTGCTPVSEACQNCYAKRMANRLRGRFGYPEDEPFRVTLHPEKLDEPLKWKKPRRVFVCSMGDLFHEDVPHSAIQKVLYRVRMAKWHTFLILTKRPERMRAFFMQYYVTGHIPNLWLGVTAENQARADERIPILLQIPAAVRFVSVEPMMGPVDLSWCNYTLDWVICGGETGPGARPMHPDWARSLRDQCQEAGTPFFFKSWGNYCAPSQMPEDTYRGWEYHHGTENCWREDDPTPWEVGKKAAGHLIDGQEWRQFPEVS
jgi:protein gp37